MFPPPTLVPLGLFKFLAEHIMSQFRLPILVAPCWMDTTWLPTVLSVFVDIPHCCPIVQNVVTDVLVDQVLRELPSLR